MTKYAFLTEFAPPDHGGIQATVGPFIEALGNDVTVIAPQQAAANERRIVRSLFSGLSRPRWWWLVAWLKSAKQQGLQTAIFGHFSSAVFAGYIASRLYGLPYVVLIHGNDLLSEKQRWSRLFIKAALLNAKFIGVNSEFVERLVRSYGVPSSRIVPTHPFVRQKDIPEMIQLRDTNHIFTISRLVARKNVDSVLRAVAKLHSTQPAVHLDIAGDGPERPRLESLAKELEITEVVTFHGAVDDQEKWRLFQQASLFVMAPTVREAGSDVEGLGLVYLEAAACGLPIIASDTGGVRNAVIHGQTGLLVDPNKPEAIAQGINQLLSDPALALSYGQAGKALVEREYTDTIRIGRFITQLRGLPEASQPLVSIIIPAYQSARTITATLESVKKQTWNNKEIIVVDDGSTDDLNDKLRPFIPDITVIKQNNFGAPTARNNGFDRSRGDYILFLDADTALEPLALEKMVAALITHPAADFVYSDFYFGWKKFHLFEYSSLRLHQQNFIHTTSLIRRSKFSRFDPNLTKFQDWDLWLTMDEQGKRGIWIPEVLFRVAARQSNIGISTWLPSLVYRLPFIGRGHGNATIAKYRRAESVIRKKHGG